MKPDRKIYQKYHFQVNKIEALVKDKENELKSNMEKSELNMKEIYQTKSEIAITYKLYNDLKKEIDDINSEISKLLNEINRIKPSLKYKTKKEYEEMIARLESEMHHNCVYSKNDEKRVLDEIASMKRGIQLLNDFDLKKTFHSDLIDKLKSKKNEKNTNWNAISVLNSKQTVLKENLKALKEITMHIQADLERYKKQKTDLKKQFKKEQQEYIAYIKELQAKKSIERAQHDSQLKITNEMYSLQAIIRDCTKLSTYLQNFQKIAPILPADCTDPAITWPMKKPSTLNINFETAESSSSTAANTPNDSTPTNIISKSYEETGFYIWKKKTFDDLPENIHKKTGKRSSKYRNKAKPIRITYTPEELILFEKLKIAEPTCNTAIEDCLKILNAKREEAQNQLKVCEQQNQLIDSLNDFLDDAQYENENDSDDTENTNITLIKTTLDCLETYLGLNDNEATNSPTSNSDQIEQADGKNFIQQKSLLFSDTNSEMSYLDSNYESDCSCVYKTPNKTNNDDPVVDHSNTVSDDSDVTIPDVTTSRNKTIDNLKPMTESSINPPPVIINRQLSDGYSSSGQLSAGSNIGGQNPFFTNPNSNNNNSTVV